MKALYDIRLGYANANVLKALRSVSPVITKPVLVVTANLDPVCLPSITLNNTLPYAPLARVRALNSGHFVQLEAADQLNYELHDFLKTLAQPTAAKGYYKDS